MLHSYWTTAIRSFRKKLSNTLIIILSLTAGITSFIFISIFVHHEKNFDRFHQHGDRIFRVQQNHYSKKELTNSSASANFGIGRDMATDFPEIEHYTIILKNISLLRKDDKVFKEERSAFVSEDFFKVFSFKLIKGNDSLVLRRPHTIALSETLAHKIFKDEDPIGKSVSFKGYYDAEVTGVFQDMPENSHINLHVLLPIETYKLYANHFVLDYPWRWDGFVTYIKLNEPSQRAQVEEKIPDLIERKTGSWLRESDQNLEINLQPLVDIHLNSNLSDELSPNGDQETVSFLSIVAIAILIIAWINYLSLATVRSLDRAKEVGIRKVLGGYRSQLIRQFLTEAFILNLVSFLAALVIVYVALPGFSTLFERNFSAAFFTEPLFWVFVIAMLAISTILTGVYPAFIISSVEIAAILKGKFSSTQGGKFLRKITVLVPFIATVVLLIGLFTVYLQLDFLKQRELGFNPHQKLVVRDSEIYDSLYKRRVDVFKKEIVKIPGIENLTYISHLPGEFINYYNDVRRMGADKKDINEYRYLTVDENFTASLQLKILAGNPFTATSKVREEIMVNETASKLLGFSSPEDALDQRVCYNNDTVTIKAVLKDYHHEAPKVKIPPTYYVYHPSGGYYFIAPVSNTSQQTVEAVRNLFEEIFPGQPYIQYFLDEKYGSQYQKDERFGTIISIFLILLLVITCSGLFSLSSYAAKFRTKEIGIRKVMGASEYQVIFLMLKEYIIIVSGAITIGIPVAYFAMRHWLETFSVRINPDWWIFLMPSLSVMAIALITVTGQTLKAAYSNPARTLRQE
jgi:putative ABC transport system permease protein